MLLTSKHSCGALYPLQYPQQCGCGYAMLFFALLKLIEKSYQAEVRNALPGLLIGQWYSVCFTVADEGKQSYDVLITGQKETMPWKVHAMALYRRCVFVPKLSLSIIELCRPYIRRLQGLVHHVHVIWAKRRLEFNVTFDELFFLTTMNPSFSTTIVASEVRQWGCVG